MRQRAALLGSQNLATAWKKSLAIGLCSLSSHRKYHLAKWSLTATLCVQCTPISLRYTGFVWQLTPTKMFAHQLSAHLMQKFTSTASFLMFIKARIFVLWTPRIFCVKCQPFFPVHTCAQTVHPTSIVALIQLYGWFWLSGLRLFGDTQRNVCFKETAIIAYTQLWENLSKYGYFHCQTHSLERSSKCSG